MSNEVKIGVFVMMIVALLFIGATEPAQACACGGGFSVDVNQVSDEAVEQLWNAGWYGIAYDGAERLYPPLGVTIPLESWTNLKAGIDSGCLLTGYLAEDYSCIPA